MSAMKDVVASVREMLLDDPEISIREMASFLDVPEDMVIKSVEFLWSNDGDFRELMTEDDDRSYDDSMDGDAGSALASAGWGTDEDYGGAAELDF